MDDRERTAQRVVDALNTNHVLLAAVRLCRDSLGDDVLWAATEELRGALTDFADGEPFPWSERWL